MTMKDELFEINSVLPASKSQAQNGRAGAHVFDLRNYDKYAEDNRLEVKKAAGDIPASLWETYSAFANCYGGVIILCMDTGWKDPAGLKKQLLDIAHDRSKVSINLLTDKDVETFERDGDAVLVIHVPMAGREQRPVYINNDLLGGTFRRNDKGDYPCTSAQIRAMLRDEPDDTMDMEVLDDFPLEELNRDTIRSYRNRHLSFKEGKPFKHLDNEEYLHRIGAAALSEKDGKLHPTAAGMLMFGDDYNIVRHFPDYFLDYREMLDPSTRWTDRIQSSSGEWSGNVCDFFIYAYFKIARDLKVPPPVAAAVREAMVNSLVHADYFGTCGVVILKKEDSLVLANPGYIRTGKIQMRRGGVSDPRNKALMKMFNLIQFGKGTGSGVPGIFHVWQEAGWEEPVIREQFNPDRTILELSFRRRNAYES